MFLWRLSKHSIPTEDVRAHRHMSTSNSCALCGGPDSWRHSLLECTVARCTWALADEELANNLLAYSDPSAKCWLFSLMETMPRSKFIKIAVTLWAIWFSQRKAIHEGIFQSPQSTKEFIQRYLEDLDIINERKPATGASAVQRGSLRIRPKAPPAGSTKIHVDAGCRSWGGTTAAVCRDDRGEYLGSSAIVLKGISDPATLEALVCREALSLAEDLHIHHMVISSDSRQVVGDITSENSGKYDTVIKEIRSRARHFMCNFMYESRNSNVEAHSLAKHALSLGLGRHVWLGNPHNPRCISQTVVFDR